MTTNEANVARRLDVDPSLVTIDHYPDAPGGPWVTIHVGNSHYGGPTFDAALDCARSFVNPLDYFKAGPEVQRVHNLGRTYAPPCPFCGHDLASHSPRDGVYAGNCYHFDAVDDRGQRKACRCKNRPLDANGDDGGPDWDDDLTDDEVERIAGMHLIRHPNCPPNTVFMVPTEWVDNPLALSCLCGHARRDHIYQEGACRPGFVCAEGCTEYRERTITGSWEIHDIAYDPEVGRFVGSPPISTDAHPDLDTRRAIAAARRQKVLYPIANEIAAARTEFDLDRDEFISFLINEGVLP